MKSEKNAHADEVRARVIALIESEYESDAAFERALGLSDKTVNNWRRGRSASYMKMIPRLSEVFRITASDLLGIPMEHDTAELSEEEWHLLHLYRKARHLPKSQRTALAETMESVVTLYLKSQEPKTKKTR